MGNDNDPYIIGISNCHCGFAKMMQLEKKNLLVCVSSYCCMFAQRDAPKQEKRVEHLANDGYLWSWKHCRCWHIKDTVATNGYKYKQYKLFGMDMEISRFDKMGHNHRFRILTRRQ